MTDISKTIEPKSDQLNSDDLITGEKTLHITGVKVVSGDQPVHIHYEGDNGKPWKPCKSMRRVLVMTWGNDGDAYVGRICKVYNDKAVKWAGEEVGGIRISAMSHIDQDLRLMLTVSKGKRSPYTIKKIATEPLKIMTAAEKESYCARIEICENMADLGVIGEEIAKAGYDKSSASDVTACYKAAVKRIRSGDLIK